MKAYTYEGKGIFEWEWDEYLEEWVRNPNVFTVPGEPTTTNCIENRTGDPSNPAVGQIWLRTDL